MTGLGFAGGTFDRADALRSQPERIAALLADPAARRVRLDELDPVWEGDALVLDPVPSGADLAGHVFLGLAEAGPLFAALAEGPMPGFRRPSARTRDAAAILRAPDLALYGAARSLVDWHARHGFCAACGATTAPVRGGWSRSCAGCGAEHFPRVDPVVIMLAEHEGRALVGRQHGWAPGFFSALAGFVEPGETIEEAVRRELFEEAGVRAAGVRYAMSQPWPFPSSLMIACVAPVADDALTLDPNEIEQAIWVTRADVAAALAGDAGAPFVAPQPMAVAHHLLVHWLEAGMR